MESLIPEYTIAGYVRPRTGSILPNVAPANAYPTADGEHLISGNQDTVWKRLAEAMGRPELGDDERFATHNARGQNQAELDDLIGAWSRTLTSDELEAVLNEHSVPNGRIYTAPDMLADAHFAAREAIVTLAHPLARRLPDAERRAEAVATLRARCAGSVPSSASTPTRCSRRCSDSTPPHRDELRSPGGHLMEPVPDRAHRVRPRPRRRTAGPVRRDHPVHQHRGRAGLPPRGGRPSRACRSTRPDVHRQPGARLRTRPSRSCSDQIRESINTAVRDVVTAKLSSMLMGMSAETFWGGVAGNAAFEAPDRGTVRRPVGQHGRGVVPRRADGVRSRADRGVLAVPTDRRCPGGRRTSPRPGSTSPPSPGSAVPRPPPSPRSARHRIAEIVDQIDSSDVDAIVQVGTNLNFVRAGGRARGRARQAGDRHQHGHALARAPGQRHRRSAPRERPAARPSTDRQGRV